MAHVGQLEHEFVASAKEMKKGMKLQNSEHAGTAQRRRRVPGCPCND